MTAGDMRAAGHVVDDKVPDCATFIAFEHVIKSCDTEPDGTCKLVWALSGSFSWTEFTVGLDLMKDMSRE